MDSCPVFSQVLPFFLDVLAAQHIELSGDDPVHGFVGSSYITLKDHNSKLFVGHKVHKYDRLKCI